MDDVEIRLPIRTSQGFLRDESGRFLSAVKGGGKAAVNEIADAIAGFAIIFAPKRSGELAGSVEPVSLGATSAAAIARAGHAAPQEHGASAHSIGEAGQVLANREEGFYATGPVWHPGNPATHFLARAAAVVSPRAVGIVRKNMPG